MPIRVLSEIVAAQIAAGEVVERPASVVKELIENALDAGARTIRVEVEGGGRRLIRITDDGSGIALDEAEVAFVRHATSKLTTIDDLDNIHTLGFRGEALASIAAVSRVTMLTRVEGQQAGMRLRLEGGSLLERAPVGAAVGTVITVEDLFYNTPARLKFLKAESTERRHIDTIIARYAMAYPNVRFTLSQDGRMTFTTSGNGDLADVLVEALGLEIMRDMIEVVPLPPPRPDLPEIAVWGYTSTPHLNRNTRSHITLFVNGRAIQDTSLTYAVAQAYHTLMPSDRYPIAVVMIQLEPSEVDVNVHPTKAEVRFRSPEAVFGAVQRSVRRAVITRAPVPGLGSGRTPEGAETAPIGTELDQPGMPTFSPAPWRTAAYGPNQTVQPTQLDLDLPDHDAGRYTGQIPPQERPSTPESAPDQVDFSYELPPETRRRSLPPMRVIGQLAAMYILAEGPAALYLVDQHAAHERILYEQFMAAQAAKRPIAQHTLEGITVQLSAAAARLVDEYAEALQSVGFELEPFGGSLFRVQAVPAALTESDPGEAVVSILSDLERGLRPGESTIEAQIVLRICKAGAVKAGQTLSYQEMVNLMKQLERCEFPRTCPHGRPTMIHIGADQLAKEFGRT